MDDIEWLEAQMTDDRDTAGRDREVADIRLLRAVCDADGPVASAAEIADAVGMSRAGVTNRLHQLQDRGFLFSKEVGNGLVWWPNFYPTSESESGD